MATKVFYMPIEKTYGIKSVGDFKAAGKSGILPAGIAANGPVWSMRWSSTTLDCIVWYIRWWWYLGGTGFTAGQTVSHSLYRLRGYSAVDSGQTSMIPASGEQKFKNNMADSVVGDMRISTTAVVTAGTRTVETLPIMTKGLFCATTTLSSLPEPAPWIPGSYVAYLSANGAAASSEGLVLQNDILLGAYVTDGLHLIVEAAWSEVEPMTLSADDVNIQGRDNSDGY